MLAGFRAAERPANEVFRSAADDWTGVPNPHARARQAPALRADESPQAARCQCRRHFATIIEVHYKYGVIVPLSEELVRLSSPSAEATVRRKILGAVGGLAPAIDNQLLLPAVAASAGVYPASLTNGSTGVTTTVPPRRKSRRTWPACWRPRRRRARSCGS